MELHFNLKNKFKISSASIARFCLVETIQPSTDFNNTLDINRKLNELLNPTNGIIDGNRVKDVIFPTFEGFDIFISHSHNNTHEAEAYAQSLRRRNSDPFLDSYVWSSADGLLKEIDRQYCITPDGRHYDYNKRNFSSSHVHTMLSMAILEMIARCESFIFIESDDSIDFEELRGSGARTQSPWIYQELQYVRMLSAASNQRIDEGRMFSNIQDSLKISYEANLNDFIRLLSRNINAAFPIKSRRSLL